MNHGMSGVLVRAFYFLCVFIWRIWRQKYVTC